MSIEPDASRRIRSRCTGRRSVAEAILYAASAVSRIIARCAGHRKAAELKGGGSARGVPLSADNITWGCYVASPASEFRPRGDTGGGTPLNPPLPLPRPPERAGGWVADSDCRFG